MSTAEPAQAGEEDRPPGWVLWPTGHRAMQTIYDQLADPKYRPSLLLSRRWLQVTSAENPAAVFIGVDPSARSSGLTTTHRD
jgi:hypothetical protein